MKPTSMARAALPAVVAAMAIVASSCSEKLKSIVIPNQLPEVRITAAPIDTTVTCTPDPVRSCYALTLNWVGHDPDGRVDHYLFAVDPPSGPNADTLWQFTRDNEKRLLFRASTVLPMIPAVPPVARDHHVFVIKAVDDRGGVGPSVFRAFFSFTEAPIVNILNPTPSSLLTPILTPSVRITWSGEDRDGVFTTKPVKYKYALLSGSSEFPIDLALQNPDSLRRFYAPRFVSPITGRSWDSTSAETTVVQFTNLTPSQDYMFVVVAFDEAGAYSPVMSRNNNMLRFGVGFAGTLGPKITFFNEFFEYTYRAGGFCPCPQSEVFIEVPAQIKVTFNWFAEPPVGAAIRHYRWSLDNDDVSDDTPRTDEETDLKRWSAPSFNVTSATVGPFPGGEEHRFYLEASDNIGLRSLGIVRFLVVQSSFETPLGIVDDTRMKTERFLSPTDCRPQSGWPNAAELDTFLYARGWFPYRCYPAGTTSRPGLFAGYPFDTVSTRIGKNDLTVRLSNLGRFRHLVWIVDATSATNRFPGTHPTAPMTALRYMTEPGRFNTLGAYVKQGGKVWMTGGGGAYASTISWDDGTNNLPTTTFSFTSRRRELVPGRFMYDLPAWQSEIRTSNSQVRITRFSGRFGDTETTTQPGSPYAMLPARMRLKNEGVADSLPPLRTNPTEFYRNETAFEFLQLANRIVENVSSDPDSLDEQSTLDTLFRATGTSLPRPFPEDPTFDYILMTHYKGPRIPQGFVFSGLDIWTWKRADCAALVDFVLQRLWGLQRTVQVTRVFTPEREPAMVRPRDPLAASPIGQAKAAKPDRGRLRGGLHRVPATGSPRN